MLANIYDQFSRITHSFPEKIAVVSDKEYYTYKDLLLYSESIALTLLRPRSARGESWCNL